MAKINFADLTPNSVASVIHELWRASHVAQKGDVPRDKDTTDTEWLKANADKPYCNAEAGQVNINIDFDLLPSDWQAENLAAAAHIIPVFQAAVESVSESVHVAWCDRQRPSQAGGEWFDSLDIPYGDLPEGEKFKDADHLIACFKVAVEG